MRLTLLLSLISVFTVSVTAGYSQNTGISLDLKGVTLKDALGEIENLTGLSFIYKSDLINPDQKIELEVKNVSIEKLLETLFAGRDIYPEILDNSIIVLLPRTVDPDIVVTGLVTDNETGDPLPGVYIRIDGTATGSVTGIDGRYSIVVPGKNYMLRFSYIGYREQLFTMGNSNIVNITLIPEVQTLEEVVVIGYGVTTRRNFTGAVTSVDMEDSPSSLSSATNVSNVLRGNSTGIMLSQPGEAGEQPSILIRGQKSITNAANEPLTVLDGVIFNGSLNDLDPNTIENISVLKDATTLAAYGSKAANGVIMITSKKGRPGKPVIDFNSYIIISKPGYKSKIRDGSGYIELMNYRSGLEPDANPSLWMYPLELANYLSGEETDWRDYIDRTGVLQNYSLSFSGANEYSNYYMAGSHLDQHGIYYGDDYSRNTISTNISTHVNDFLQIGASYNFAANDYPGVSPSYGAAVTLSPWCEPDLINGRMRKFVDGHEDGSVNPLWNTFNGVDRKRERRSNILGGFLNVKVPYINGLSFRITGSYTITGSETRQFVHETNFPDMSLGDNGYTPEVFDKQLVNASGSVDEIQNIAWVLDNIITYDYTPGDHNVNISLVYTRNSSRATRRTTTGSDFRGIGNTSLGYYGLPNADILKMDRYTWSLHNDIGYLARLNYSYKNTYHLNALVRYDGSSVFGKNKKWGLFPSVGGAWTVSNENFMSRFNFIDYLKLKASWGLNGAQTLDPYQTLSQIAMGRGGNNPYYMGDKVVYGQRITALGNPDLAWVSTSAVNAGFEVDFLKRFFLNFDLYKSITKDQIFSRNIPVMTSGLTSQFATMGRVDNWGVEIELSSDNINTGLLKWTSAVFFTLNRNKLVELYGDGQDDISGGLFLGKSLGAVYGYKWTGVVQPGEENYLFNVVASPGDAKYADLNHDRQLTAADRQILGYNKENFTVSLTNTINYRNFELYVLFNGVFGGNGYGLAQNNSAYLTADKYFYHNTLDHPYWTPENFSREYPRWDYIDDKFTALQSYTFIRLQDMNFSWNFRKDLIGKAGINNLKLYLAFSNLFFIAPEWEGSDPEVRSFTSAQLPRSIKLGLDIQF